ncbi:DUF1365 domain-containing protein [Desulfopila sp. IMCC35008]|uniref:DUF1365 domain-containing protein n=1 Tax=Desulfopila sp. IMCC35008 TaxID=2653858 RepID=UPI0013D50799|nr:DUF1365 domain-containing protein [Desulfopila sp. IMCC35008]
MKPALYIGTIAHRRRIPVDHTFQYPFFMWFLNLDELDQVPELGKWFSQKRWALSRFNRSDYYGDPSVPLADAIRTRMEELTGEPVKGQVCGLMNMRTLGVYFSPVNFYYGYDERGTFSHFLAEVSNIPWNERHQYSSYVGNGELSPHHPKEFHVSPFNSQDQHYSWQLREPGPEVSVQLQVSDERGHIFTAMLGLTRHPFSLEVVRARLMRKPAMTLSIVAGIYWQAFNLFRKGVPYVPYKKEMI